MTQEQLAEQIHVTRQTVSSWETGRTQPDINMLELLSAALDAEIEALIYGKKRRVGTEDPARAKRRTLTVVLSVLGTLLTAVGLIVILVYFWQDLEKFLRTFLSFLPLLAGTGAGLFAVFSKKQTVFRRESAAVLWIAGVIASNALINAVFDSHFGFEKLLLADIMFTLPVMFLLQAASGCAADYALLIVYMLEGGGLDAPSGEPLISRVPTVLLAAAPTAVCLLFALKNRLSDAAKKIVVALSLLVVPFCVVCWVVFLSSDTDAGIIMLFALSWFFSLYLIDRTRKTGLPLRSAAGALYGLALFLWFLCQLDGESFPLLQFLGPWYLTLCLPVIGISLYYGRQRLAEDKLKWAATPVMALLAVLTLTLVGRNGVPQLLCSLLFGVLAITAGIIRADLAAANFGVVNVLAVMLVLLYHFADLGLLQIGGIIFGAGVVLLLINRMVLKKIAAKEKAEKEAAEDEAS